MFAIHAVHTHHDVRNETGTHNWGQNTTVSNLSGNCVLILSPVSYADFSHIRQNRLPGSVVDLQPLLDLAGVFAIDVAGYAVMSNHYHAVLRIDRGRALGWSTDEVLARWTKLFSGPVLVQRYLTSG